MEDFEQNSRIVALQTHIEQCQRLEPIVFRHQATGQRYQISTYPIAGDKNSLIHIEDISTRYLAEQRQRMAEMIFDQNPSSVIVLTRALTIETKNNAFTRIFGDIDVITQLYLRQPINFTFAVFKQLLTHGFLKIESEISSTLTSQTPSENSSWLPCLITIKMIKNSDNKVDSFIVSISDQTQSIELKRLNFETNHDALTGLANRQNAHQTLSNAHAQKESIHVLFLDLDGFKAVNDTYGHQCGDEFLLGISLSKKEPTQSSHIHEVLQRILAAINQPIVINGHTPSVSASIGVYYWEQGSDITLESALQQADTAMYRAKVSGKNQYYLI